MRQALERKSDVTTLESSPSSLPSPANRPEAVWWSLYSPNSLGHPLALAFVLAVAVALAFALGIESRCMLPAPEHKREGNFHKTLASNTKWSIIRASGPQVLPQLCQVISINGSWIKKESYWMGCHYSANYVSYMRKLHFSYMWLKILNEVRLGNLGFFVPVRSHRITITYWVTKCVPYCSNEVILRKCPGGFLWCSSSLLLTHWDCLCSWYGDDLPRNHLDPQ